jgi:multidrug resistance efflux pump
MSANNVTHKGAAILKFIQEEIVGTENKFFAWCLVGAVGLIFMIGFYLSTPNLSFHGLATTRETVINFEYPVEIHRVHVLPGQKVKKGELLIEMNQNALDTQIRELSAAVAQLKAEKALRDQMNSAVGNSHNALEGDPLAVELRDKHEELSYPSYNVNATASLFLLKAMGSSGA